MTDTSFEQLIDGCEAEELHRSGAIQNFGALIALEGAAPYRVTHASENLEAFIDRPWNEVLGLALSELRLVQVQHIEEDPKLNEPGHHARLPLQTQHKQNLHDALVIRGPDNLLLELEKPADTMSSTEVFDLQRSLFRLSNSDAQAAAHHQRLVDRIRLVIRFDRVLLYKFHEDWSGEVVAEAAEDGIARYMGLRFPASDIPAIARRLYLLNPFRMIPSVDEPAVAIRGLGSSPPDLTWSTLRSVSPLHLQYLRNMGVAASFSVPVIVGGRLWGLVASHHPTPKTLSPDQRYGCVAMTHEHALGLASHLATRRLQMLDSVDRQLEDIMDALSGFSTPKEGFQANASLLMEKMSASGFASCTREGFVSAGQSPELEELLYLDDWFLASCQDYMVTTDCLESKFPNRPSLFAHSAGMFAIKARSPRSGWLRLYWFRPPAPKEVSWAGDPTKPVQEGEGPLVLSPRRSFEKWVEITTNSSRPWVHEQVMIASKIRANLLRWL